MNIKALTDKGPYRDSNQDTLAYGLFDNGDSWAVVCDGMGGASGGEIASELCVGNVSEAIKKGHRKGLTVKAAKNLLESAISKANYVVYDKSVKNSGLHGMGTTVVAVIVIKNIAVVAHVGDSRAYIISGGAIRQITKDHSLVQLMVDEGRITPEEAKIHPERNVITRAVGVVNFVDVDFEIVDINQGDKLLVCTDGLCGSVDDEEMLDVIKESDDFSTEKLVERAIHNGSRDNVSVVIMSADQGE